MNECLVFGTFLILVLIAAVINYLTSHVIPQKNCVKDGHTWGKWKNSAYYPNAIDQLSYCEICGEVRVRTTYT